MAIEHQYCSNRCKQLGKSPTVTQRAMISKKLRGIKRSDATKLKMSLNNACHRLEIREKLSRSRARGIANGSIAPFYRGNHGTYSSIKSGLVEHYHSFLELDRMRILDADPLVLSWTKKHGHVIPYEFDNKIRHYTPDFLIKLDDMTILEEVKGWEGEVRQPFKMKALEMYCTLKGFHLSYMNTVAVHKELKRFNLLQTTRNGDK